jgi:hypothetical protein
MFCNALYAASEHKSTLYARKVIRCRGKNLLERRIDLVAIVLNEMELVLDGVARIEYEYE